MAYQFLELFGAGLILGLVAIQVAKSKSPKKKKVPVRLKKS